MQQIATLTGVMTRFPIEERMAAIAEAGFDAVCLDFERDMEASETSWENQVRLAEKYHLPVENVHLTGVDMTAVWQSGEAGERVTRRLIDELRDMSALGIKVGVAHVTWGYDRPAGERKLALSRYLRAAEAAEKYGVILALENSVYAEYVHFLLENIKIPAIGFCYDSGHENAFTPEEDYLSRYSDRLVAMHLHDNDGKNDNHYLPFHPNGTIDWQKKAAVLSKTALYRRMIMMEAVPDADTPKKGFADLMESAKRLARITE